MKVLLQSMEKNINAELEVQLRIQDLLDRQLDVLTSGKPERMEGILQEAEAELQASAVLESQRSELLQEMGRALGVPYGTVTLQMVEDAVGDEARPLCESGSQLKEILERIRESNRQVSLLLRHSVMFIEDLLNVVAGNEVSRTYTRRGQVEKQARTAAAEG